MTTRLFFRFRASALASVGLAAAIALAVPARGLAPTAPATQAATAPDGSKPAAPSALKDRVDAVLSKLPATTPAEQDALASELASMGAPAVMDICDRLRPSAEGRNASAEFALNALAVRAGRPGAEKERRAFAGALVSALAKPAAPEVKAFVISQAQLAGRDECVGALAGFLSDPALVEPAARALAAIRTRAAGKALLGALRAPATPARTPAAEAAPSAPSTAVPSRSPKVIVIQALGEMRFRPAVENLLVLADGTDEALRGAALAALAEIGDPAARGALRRVRVASSDRERAEAPVLYLRFARRLFESGRASDGLSVCRELMASYTGTGESAVASSALALLAGSMKDRALPDLLKAASGPDAGLAGQAMNLGAEIPGRSVTRRWIEAARAQGPVVRAAIVGMLGRRGDREAAAFAVESLAAPDPGTRLAAIGAAARLAPDTIVGSILPFLDSAIDAERTAARDAVLGLPGETAVPAAMERYEAFGENGRAAILEILGEKAARDRIDFIFAKAKDASPVVRTAAVKALETTVAENDFARLFDLVLSDEDPANGILLQNAVVAAARRIADPEARANPVLEALRASESPRRIELIRPLPRIGGTRALAAVIAETANADPQARSIAVYTLSQWRAPAAAPALLSIARSTDSRKDLLSALEGYVRLVRWADDPVETKLAKLREAMAIPKDDAARRPVMQALADFPSMESFLMIGGCLDSPALRTEAAAELVEMAASSAPETRWLGAHQPVSLLRKAAAAVEDPAEKARAEAAVDANLRRAGFVPLFDGTSLAGWKGLVADPPHRAAMSAEVLAKEQADADARMRAHWSVQDGALVFDGKGESLCTARDYSDFELLADWRIGPKGDSGLYLRGSPQVQIWDPAEHPEGSGGLYNNQKNPSKPSSRADRPVGEWNTFRVIMMGDRVTVYLNDEMVVDNVLMENYWERDKPIYPSGQVELQAHGNELAFRNVYIREIPRDGEPADGGPGLSEAVSVQSAILGLPEAARSAGRANALSEAEKAEGFVPLFDGADLSQWTGDTRGYAAEDGKIVVHPERGSGNLYTAAEYGNFVFRFEFKLTPGANNGVGIRTPAEGDAAYVGMEVQILEDSSPVYWNLQPYQYHGSVYGIVPARRGFQRPPGEWNEEEIRAEGRRVTVTLNGTVIVDADLDAAAADGTMDHQDHPGLKRDRGRIGFLGHGSRLELRRLRVKELR